MMSFKDGFDECERDIIAPELVDSVCNMLGQKPAFDGLLVRPSSRAAVVVNGSLPERETWVKCVRSIMGDMAETTFVARPVRPGIAGFSMVAARGRGTLDFQTFECGCRAGQIPGEDDWQLIRGRYCRFPGSEHHPREWPIDPIVRPIR